MKIKIFGYEGVLKIVESLLRSLWRGHKHMYLTRQAAQLDYAKRHRILIEFLKQGDRSKVNEIMLDPIMPSAEKAIAWWERRQEKMAESQEVTG